MQSRCFFTLKHKLFTNLLNYSKGINRNYASKSQEKQCKGPLFDKCVLINGGPSGIGLECAKALLAKGCRGITLTGPDQKEGEQALKCICEKFGNNRAVFLKCDFTKPESIDWAFKNTLRVYDGLDIVINNIEIMNDKQWEYQIANNINGYLVANLLSLQYMSRTCHGNGGCVVNIFSTMSINPLHGCPIYNATQSAILGLTRSLGGGCQASRTGVNIMGLCLGLTDECLLKQGVANAINEKFATEFKNELDGKFIQDMCIVQDGLIKVLEDSCSGNVYAVEEGNTARKLKFPSVQDIADGCDGERDAKKC